MLLFVLSITVTALVVFVERGQRRILINYPKRQQGRKLYGGQSSFLPLKLNMAGVIPPIFASSIILFPATVAGWFGNSEGLSWLRDIATMCLLGSLFMLCFMQLQLFSFASFIQH